jgi:hypothetical protein
MMTPEGPKVEASKKPKEEQLTHPLEITLSEAPESNDLLNLRRVFFKMYTFILITTPKRIELIVEITNPATASGGR